MRLRENGGLSLVLPEIKGVGGPILLRLAADSEELLRPIVWCEGLGHVGAIGEP